MKVGILGFQGSVEEHIASLLQIGVEVITVKDVTTLAKVSGIILPGGESTTHLKLIKTVGLFTPLREVISEGLPVLATCAGIILVAYKIDLIDQDSLRVLDIEIVRNGYGSQYHSFAEDINILDLNKPFKAVFIRAPIIKRVGENVAVLARDKKENPCFVKRGKILGLTFHPELTNDLRVHKMFTDLI